MGDSSASGILKRGQSRPPRPENRSAERYSCILDISYLSREDDDVNYAPNTPARVRDISRGGLCLVLAERFEPDTLLTLGLDSTTDGFVPPLRLRVIHSTRSAHGEWLIGCAFLRPLDDEELRSLLGNG